MSIIQKKFNYFRTPTAWQQTMGWRKRRLEAEQRIQNQIMPVVQGIATAQSLQITGTAEIAVKMATARIAKETAAKFSQLKNLK